MNVRQMLMGLSLRSAHCRREGSEPIEVIASADGYEDRVYTLNFARDGQLAVILKKKPPRPTQKSGKTGTPFKPLGYED